MPKFAASPLAGPLPVAVRLAEEADPSLLHEWIRQAAGPVPAPSLLPRPDQTKVGIPVDVLRALAARDSSVLDLAVATFAMDHDVLLGLWRREDWALRIAIASNRHRVGLTGLDVTDVLRSGHQDLIAAALQSGGMTSAALAAVLRREAPLDDVSEDRWLLGVAAIAHCPTLKLRRDVLAEGFDWDGSRSFESGAAASAASRRPHVLEPTVAHAAVLEALLEAAGDFSPPLLAEYGYTTPADGGRPSVKEAREGFVRAMFARWRRPAAAHTSEPRRLVELDCRAGTRLVIAAAAAGAWLMEDELFRHEDRHVRLGPYRGLRTCTPDRVREASERDGVHFLDEAVGNAAVHEGTDVAREMAASIERVTVSEWNSPSASERRQNLQRRWREYGLHLWASLGSTYPHPDRLDEHDRRQSREPVETSDAIERIRQEASEAFVREARRLEAQAAQGGVDPAQAARAGLDAVWLASAYVFAALARLGEEAAALSARESPQPVVQRQAGGTGLWAVVAAMIVGAVLGRALLH